ncbi:hypothetical protein M8C21_033044 [Ambrosia artemisiifolia]|uniref:Uncharacterized protein n=1 Tax=Ambrosia artemisiifolia TaxID=4212 RepID=A0AAD5CG04_AMBAR|nr:hypothetical protein M8C21_033044 [Ambrosia artemisiifolia]
MEHCFQKMKTSWFKRLNNLYKKTFGEIQQANDPKHYGEEHMKILREELDSLRLKASKAQSVVKASRFHTATPAVGAVKPMVPTLANTAPKPSGEAVWPMANIPNFVFSDHSIFSGPPTAEGIDCASEVEKVSDEKTHLQDAVREEMEGIKATLEAYTEAYNYAVSRKKNALELADDIAENLETHARRLVGLKMGEIDSVQDVINWWKRVRNIDDMIFNMEETIQHGAFLSEGEKQLVGEIKQAKDPKRYDKERMKVNISYSCLVDFVPHLLMENTSAEGKDCGTAVENVIDDVPDAIKTQGIRIPFSEITDDSVYDLINDLVEYSFNDSVDDWLDDLLLKSINFRRILLQSV